MISLLPVDAYKASGVYIITNTVNAKVYVGSSQGLRKRYHDHKRSLELGTHFNSLLQNFVNKYTCKVLRFELLELCSPEDLMLTEQKHLNSLKSYYREKGFNLLPVAGRTKGYKHSDETKAKVAAARRGKPMSEETKAKIAEGNKGKVVSIETRAKMSAVRIGKKRKQ